MIVLWLWLLGCGMPGLWRWEGCVDEAARLDVDRRFSVADGDRWVLHAHAKDQGIPGMTCQPIHSVGIELGRLPTEPTRLKPERARYELSSMGGGLHLGLKGTLQAEDRGDYVVAWLDAETMEEEPQALWGRFRLPKCGADHFPPPGG